MERRPSSLVCASFNPSRWEREKGSKLLARGALGPFARGVGSCSPRAPVAVQVERRLAWRTSACRPKDHPRSLLRLLEQGPGKSVCFCDLPVPGVSAVISASDLDGPTFHPRRVGWHRSNRALPSEGEKAHSQNGVPNVSDWRALICLSLVHTHCVSEACVSQESLPQETAEADESARCSATWLISICGTSLSLWPARPSRSVLLSGSVDEGISSAVHDSRPEVFGFFALWWVCSPLEDGSDFEDLKTSIKRG